MAIEKVVRRFRIPSKNIDWALTQSENEFGAKTLTLYKNSRISKANLDCFTKAAEKEIREEGGTGFNGWEYNPKRIYRTQFDNKGEEIGGSCVILDSRNGHKNIKIQANDQSVEMSDGALKIDDKGVKVVKVVDGKFFNLPAHDFKIQFKGDKLTPMAKRILKLFNQLINKQ